MFFTYKSRKVTNWKPNQKKKIVPKYSKPNNNSDNTSSDFNSKFGSARPQKHYRKHLLPYYNTNSKRVSLDDINSSSNALINEINNLFDPCNNSVSLNYVHEYILDKPKVCLGTKTNGVCNGGNTNVYYRSATTNLDKKYFQTSSSYLKSKCKTYNQNIKLGEKLNNESYKMGSCHNDNCNTTIYKPNNKTFSKQGSVESSTRLLKLKNDTINKNGASFRSAYGRQASNAGRYKNSLSNENIIFEKHKYNLNPCSVLPQNFRKNVNNKQNC